MESSTTAIPVDDLKRPSGVLLHIGPHKTGTTAIQGAFAEQRASLRAQGILYPGSKRMEHNRPAAAAIQRELGWNLNTVDRKVWTDLVETVTSWQEQSVLSSEVFCEGDSEAVAGIASDLASQQLRVVITLRPLEELLPSNWQQYIKSGYRIPYNKWLGLVLEERGTTAGSPSFWKRNDIPALIDRWTAVVPASSITCVIVDRANPRNLFDSFEDLLGLSRDTLTPQAASRNRSLSLPEVELLRALNRRLRHDMAHPEYVRLIKKGTVLSLVENRTPKPDERRLATPGWAVARAREFGREDVAAIRDSGVQVKGDLAAQVPSSPLPPDDIVNKSPATPTALAADFLAALAQTAQHSLEESNKLQDLLAEATKPPPTSTGRKLAARGRRLGQRVKHSWK